MRWAEANARAAGLVTHLLGRDQLVQLLDAGGWLAAVRRLIELGFPAEPAAVSSPADFDRSVGRIAARRLALLERRISGPIDPLAVIGADEERRAIRILLRGAAQGAAPVTRLRTLIPTRNLSERTLDRLARASSPGDLIRELRRIGHPAGRALEAAERSSTGPSQVRGLFGLEIALNRWFAARATAAPRRAGPLVRRFAATLIDRENAWALLAAPGWAPDVSPDLVFLPGGADLTESVFRRLAAVADFAVIREQLAVVFARGPLAAVFGDPSIPLEQLESRALGATLAWYRDCGRRDPLGPGPLFAAIERIRAEAHDLRLVLGAIGSGATGATVEPLLMTAR